MERQSVHCSAIQWEGHLWLKRKVQRERGKARLCSVCTCRHFEKLREWGFIILRTFLITHGAISLNVYTGNIKRLTIYNTLTPWCLVLEDPWSHLWHMPILLYYLSYASLASIPWLSPLVNHSLYLSAIMNQHFHFPAYSLLPRNVLTIFVWFIVITCPTTPTFLVWNLLPDQRSYKIQLRFTS